MRNFLMVLVAVLGTGAMVHAFPPVKTNPAKEVKATKEPKAKSDKKAKADKKQASKTETAKVKK
ncbi:hypothetical protein [Flavobacterium sp. HTF]|uniref:hypothetical protein n=1 Tax=Flavobacterium sp. HTF TaxID=2170732 RepID=UPI000D5CA93D|nr:hypothetical protein [Flavobacterium sp. HTF]PWB24247.1 hypothetical protein DCO46_12550 [Flavobacterium sp. HTF]